MISLAALGVLVAQNAPAPPARCNPEAYVHEAHRIREGAVPLTLLPQDKGDQSPACLDGSPYGFYFSPSPSKSTKWTVNINGGGWCYDEVDCLCRSKTQLGTSTVLPKSGSCSCMNPNEDGSMDESCNCVHLPYSDGASFSGYRSEPWGVPNSTEKITFRGITNLDAVMDFMVAHGLGEATELVVTGGSAGGLSTFLHTDRFANRAKSVAPNVKKIAGAPVVGYFLDHDNFGHTDGYPGGPNTPTWSTPGTGANYTFWMKYIYTMQNLTFGYDGGLTEACQLKHPNEPWLCFMSPHMADVIETPFFMFNSRFDAWQLANEFQSTWTTKPEQQGVIQYGADFLEQLLPVYTGGVTKNGGMITSCICHGCPFSALILDGKNSYQHYADWFYGKTSGTAAMHIDDRLPNGNGTLTGDAFKQCSPFPYPQA
mmetsp:Transcript_31828/g.83401  ORF Transcript_31828/g.83401 Transcript_31828/m.83401 type:complete len:427 (-) Transcript_31828:1841-3121(-)